MQQRQIELVRGSWDQVLPIKTQAASLFYDRLFKLDPSVRKLFKKDLERQGTLLMAMITYVVNNLDTLEQAVPNIERLGVKHAGYGVTDADYDTVARALLWTLEQGLGDAFTPEVREAWTVAYGLMATTMKTAASSARDEVEEPAA